MRWVIVVCEILLIGFAGFAWIISEGAMENDGSVPWSTSEYGLAQVTTSPCTCGYDFVRCTCV